MKKLKEMDKNTATIKADPVILTDGAIKELNRIKKEQNISDDHGLRIGVKGGGCSGFSYSMGFDVQKEKDQVFVIKGIKVFMEKAHGIYLLGMEIDWVDGLNNRGFSFNNPNASDTCGCGTSFSA
jgi:iron-sulfur cluster assembly protein